MLSLGIVPLHDSAGFYGEGIEKWVPRYEKCLRRSVDYVVCRDVVGRSG